MAKPQLTINGHDYAPYIMELQMGINDLDADGSGRDTQTGLMYRTRIARKLKFTVKMRRLPEAIHKQLIGDLSPEFYTASFVHPGTGAVSTATFYTAERPYGSQIYDRETGKPYYVGMVFDMTQR